MEFDLQAALPQLLPKAIAWAEAQARRVSETGEALSETGTLTARKVGVQHPELIRILLVEALPLPDEPVLREAAVGTGLIGPHMAGLTLGHSILIVKGTLDLRLLSHECRHVHQYEQHGSISAFLPVYLQQIATVGYANAPLEQDARAYEQ
jgi:hypothetical protein